MAGNISHSTGWIVVADINERIPNPDDLVIIVQQNQQSGPIGYRL